MKIRVGLITILTDKIASMKSFYRDVLGFEISCDLGNYVEFLNEGVRFAICKREVMFKATHDLGYKEERKGQRLELGKTTSRRNLTPWLRSIDLPPTTTTSKSHMT